MPPMLIGIQQNRMFCTNQRGKLIDYLYAPAAHKVLAIQCLLHMVCMLTSLAQQDHSAMYIPSCSNHSPSHCLLCQTKQTGKERWRGRGREGEREDVPAINTPTISGRASQVVSYQIQIVAKATWNNHNCLIPGILLH